MSPAESPRELDDLLPWHVNGTLASQERARMEQLLVEHPEARQDLALLQDVATVMRLEHSSYDNQRSLTTLLAQVAQHRHSSQGTRRGVSWWDKMFAFLEPKLAFAVVVVAVQAAVITALLGRNEPAQFAEVRSQVKADPAAAPLYRVTFKPDSSEREIRMLLLAAHARIIEGPTQLGDYYLTLAPRLQLDGATLLEHSGLVESIQKVDHLPLEAH